MVRLNLMAAYFVLLSGFLFSVPSFSQESSTQKSTTRKATLNFEDELVEGGTQKPELLYILERKKLNYRRLIKLRQNFLPEMRKTSEDIQRVRGVN